MAIIKWRNMDSPEKAIDQLRNEMNSLFQNFWGGSDLPFRASTYTYPPLNLYEDSDNLYLTAELPGIAANEIDIDVEAEGIQIKGERKIESEKTSGHYHRRERESGAFSKKVTLPTRIDTTKVNAAMENGVLLITMAKAEEAKPKKIKVNIN